MCEYLQYYDLEGYLFRTVSPRFAKHGRLSAFDFFCIVIWKANRAKSKVANKLLAHDHHPDLDAAVQALTVGLTQQPSPKDRLRYLIEEWGLRLPMASAILTVLYPSQFTVYDSRVCEQLKCFGDLGSPTKFEHIWPGYERYRQAVEKSAPRDLSLRDKDRYLWGKSFCEGLRDDIIKRFQRGAPSEA